MGGIYGRRSSFGGCYLVTDYEVVNLVNVVNIVLKFSTPKKKYKKLSGFF